MLARGPGSSDEYGDSVEPDDGHFVEGSLEVLDEIPVRVSVAHVLDQPLQPWVQKPTRTAKESAARTAKGPLPFKAPRTRSIAPR
jgi:hypothetical protein